MENHNKNIIYIIILLRLFIFASNSHASGHSYEDLIEELAKISKETATRLKLAANDARIQAEEARDTIRYDLLGFERALRETEKFGPHKISKRLTAIVPSNNNLTWNADKSRILMVSWMPKWAADTFYRPKLGDEFTVSRDMWVTASPEIKNFIKNYKGSTPLHYRLQQLMGLPIKKTDNFFVESWVKPSDLIRPCIDSEIDDAQCEHDSSYKKAVKAEHMKWYQEEKKDKYTGKWPFPWTRAGYTYDTAKTSDEDQFGVSEFVIRPNAKIIIEAIIPTNEYK